MANKISQSDLRENARRELRRKLPGSLSRRGEEKDQEEWDALRAELCRLLLSDPDALVYLSYLASNRLSALLRDFHAFACECIVLAESNFSITPISEESSRKLQEKKDALSEALTTVRRSFERRDDVSLLKTAVAGFISETAQLSVKKKRFERSRSSLSDLTLIAQELEPLAVEIMGLSESLADSSTLMSENLIDGARSTILPSMVSALRQEEQVDPKETALKLATGVASYDAFSRPITKTFIVHTGREFPQRLGIQQTGREVTFLDTNREKVNPTLLGIKAGHTVSCSGSTASVALVQADKITLASDLSVGVGLIVRTPAQQELADFLPVLDAIPYLNMLSLSGIATFSRLRKLNRPQAVKIVRAFVNVAVSLAALTPEAARSAQVLGISVPTSATTLSAIRGFKPSVSNATVRSIDDALESLRTKGLDRVAESLVETRVGILDTKSVSLCRNATLVSQRVGELFELVNPALRL